ncbi:hypothetical protein LEMLEM_LOCUS14734 [Lemmus lemmus]
MPYFLGILGYDVSSSCIYQAIKRKNCGRALLCGRRRTIRRPAWTQLRNRPPTVLGLPFVSGQLLSEISKRGLQKLATSTLSLQ